jgi:hypothetical protein
VRELKDKGIFILGKPETVIQNIVATANVHGNVDLEAAVDILDNVMYEPDQFPGLIYRMGDPKVVLLILASGKMVCTGGKSEEMVDVAVAKLHGILEEDELIYYEWTPRVSAKAPYITSGLHFHCFVIDKTCARVSGYHILKASGNLHPGADFRGFTARARGTRR